MRIHQPTRSTAPRRSVIILAAIVPLLVGASILAWSGQAAGDSSSAPEQPGQDNAREGSKPSAWGSVDPSIPRGAARGFLEATRAGRYEEAAKALELSGLPAGQGSAEGPDLARHLKVVLDRKLWVDPERLSDRPEGVLDDGLPPELDRVGVIETKRGPVEVLLQRVHEADGRPVWKVASSTVRRVPWLYELYGYGALGEILPSWFFEVRFLEVELWQWLGLALAALAAWLVSSLLIVILRTAIHPIVKRTQTKLDDHLIELMEAPVRLSLALALFTIATLSLRLALPVHKFFVGLEKGLAVVAVTWVLMRLVHVGADLLGERLEKEGRRSVVAMIPLGRKSAKVVLIMMAAIGLLQNLGFNVTGIVAGLGVGGLALALAAQKTVENLFGGITLTVDQPVRLGDVCKWGDQTGTVEDIGLRSTRIRTVDRTLISVPNAALSQIQIENYSQRDKIRLQTTLGLRHETSPDQLRFVLAEIRKLLASHPMVDSDDMRVRLTGFSSSSLDVEVFAYVRTPDFPEFLRVREDVYLRIMDVLGASGTGFAFPSHTVYLGKDDGLDATETATVEATVRGWRERGQLPFPDLAPETVAELEGTLDYPPAGSVSAPAARGHQSSTPPGPSGSAK